jgi:uncharacterized integral membrane protein (TIGR00697 family)
MEEFNKDKAHRRWLPLIAAIFVTTLIISNIIAAKLVSVGGLIMPAAIFIFPISYIFGDILTEVYGYARSRRVIWIGFFCNLLAVAAIWVSIKLPAAPIWNLGAFESSAAAQKAYEAIFGFTPRILIASFAAYLFGEFINSFVLAKMKIVTSGKHLWTRLIGSTLLGQLADSAIFITLAFYTTIPTAILGKIILAQWLIKSAYEALATPFTYLIVNFLKKTEKEDYYDYRTNFNPLMWKE